MKIREVQLKNQGDSVFLTAECKIRHSGFDTVYFKFDKTYKDFVATDASPFAAALLIPTMKLGQDLVIEGEISEKLYYGLHQIMKKMLSWNIGLKPVAIHADVLTKDNYKPNKTAAFFSGGVDSFYTYLKNKKGDGQKIQYFILANGYDIGLDNRKLWDVTCQTVENIAREEGVEVIKIESNARNLIDPIEPWDYTHGGCLAALGLSLRKQIGDIFIASSYSYGQLFPWGSHPHTDHFWSTETLSFHHDGADITRVGKVQFISKDRSVLKYLRVCYSNKDDKFNCGFCDKCIRTMISLQIAGVLGKSETFPHILEIEKIKKLKIRGEPGAIFQRENLAELERLQIDLPLKNALREALNNISPTRSYITGAVIKLRFLDYFYNQSRGYKIYDRLRKNWHNAY